MSAAFLRPHVTLNEHVNTELSARDPKCILPTLATKRESGTRLLSTCAVEESVSRYAAAPGPQAATLARNLGLWHDVGKFNPRLQEYLLAAKTNSTLKGTGPDHKGAGAAHASRHLTMLDLLLLVQGRRAVYIRRLRCSNGLTRKWWRARKGTWMPWEASQVGEGRLTYSSLLLVGEPLHQPSRVPFWVFQRHVDNVRDQAPVTAYLSTPFLRLPTASVRPPTCLTLVPSWEAHGGIPAQPRGPPRCASLGASPQRLR